MNRHTLTVHRGNRRSEVRFRGTPNLAELLAENGFPLQRPCGGRGICGKCMAEVRGSIASEEGGETGEGRLRACRVRLTGDAEVWLDGVQEPAQIETAPSEILPPEEPLGKGYGFAADIGTTTVVLRLLNLSDGSTAAETAALNPQTSVAADVMGRIQAAMGGSGPLLRSMMDDTLEELLQEACGKAKISRDQVDAAVLTGNTAMLYLLTGRDPVSLASAPYAADCLFDCMTEWRGIPAWLPPCIGAFAGADLTCAILASGLAGLQATAMLCDIGTNGEMALRKDGRLWVTSVAAGPAFEGAGISCGCGGIRGAIDRAWPFNGGLQIHTIGGDPAVGICGSGLVDAVAGWLDLGFIDATGAMEGEELSLSKGIALRQKDIRAVQLAKAAIAAGLCTLAQEAEVSPESVERLFLAGGFGNRMNIRSAVRIGLIPALMAAGTETVGNAALAGAAGMLLDRRRREEARRIASSAIQVQLGGNPRFQKKYIGELNFPEDAE